MIDENEPNIAAALDRVSDTVTNSLKASGKADERRWRISLLFLGIGGPLLLALIISLSVQQGAIRNNERVMRRGISCLLADMDDHRHTNQFAHDTLAKAHGFSKILQSDIIPLTPQQATELKKNCDIFIQEAIGQGYGNINSDAKENSNK